MVSFSCVLVDLDAAEAAQGRADLHACVQLRRSGAEEPKRGARLYRALAVRRMECGQNIPLAGCADGQAEVGENFA